MRSWLPLLWEGAEPSPVHPPGRCQVLHTAMAGMGATISLGTGLSCFTDHGICSSETICLAHECPLQAVSDRAIGHATGTMAHA